MNYGAQNLAAAQNIYIRNTDVFLYVLLYSYITFVPIIIYNFLCL